LSHEPGQETIKEDAMETRQEVTTAPSTVPGPPEEPLLNRLTLSPEELPALDIPRQAGLASPGFVLVQIFLEVEGFGSFTIGSINTINGINSPSVVAGSTLPLSAKPAPGWKFSHWILNGLFGGTSPTHRVFAKAGLKVKAVFTLSAAADGA
jgi:hypothetical protein